MLPSCTVAQPAPPSDHILRLTDPLCYRVTPIDAAMPTPSMYRCDGAPRDFQDGSLWLHGPLSLAPEATLFVQRNRFSSLSVMFDYADGARVAGGVVRAGDYGDRWRLGSLVAFEAPVRAAPITGVTLRFDRLASTEVLMIRAVLGRAVWRETTVLAALVGATMILLALSAVYTLSLAVAVRGVLLWWHAAWAMCMLGWGALWSQFALFALPGLAGTPSSRLSMMIGMFASAAATMHARTSVDQAALSPFWRRAMAIMAGCLVVSGIGGWMATGAAFDIANRTTSLIALTDLMLVTAGMGVAWRRGSRAARDFLIAWIPSMLALAFVAVVDTDAFVALGGPQIALLITGAFQMVWLSIAITLRLSRIRIERDSAVAMQQELAELARRDSMTGLLNRRGFVAAANAVIANNDTLGLLLIDVDHFKSINDRFGHNIGDTVLCAVAAELRKSEEDGWFAGRMGGEEFVLGKANSVAALLQKAETLRQSVEAGRYHDDVWVTISIGIAVGGPGQDFDTLLKLADVALYRAKREGRNRVVSSLTMVTAA